MATTSITSHPDYLAYFNAFAGHEPADVLIDSDLDWGQDLKRLSARLKEVGATAVTFDSFQPADLSAMGFPRVYRTNPIYPSVGWNAVSVTMLKSGSFDVGRTSLAPWPDRIAPSETVGKGILLWYFPPKTSQSSR